MNTFCIVENSWFISLRLILMSCGLFVLCSASAATEESIDSLKQMLYKEVGDQKSVDILNLSYETHMEDLPKALAYADIALEKAQSLEDFEVIFYVHRNKGYYFENYNQLPTAIKSYVQALETAQKKDDNELKLTVYFDLAITHRKLGNYQKTKDYNLKALELAKDIKHRRGMEISYHGLGYLYETIGDYDKAIEMYFKSMEVAEGLGNMNGVITTMQNISTTYSKLNNQDMALETIEKAYLLALQHTDSLKTANVLLDYGNILANSGKYDEALDKLNSTLLIYKKGHDKSNIARTLVQLAEIYTEKGAYEHAQSLFLQSLTYGSYINSGDYANLYYKLGLLYLKKEQINQAEQAFKKSIKIAEEHNLKNLIQENNYSLYKIYVGQGLYKEALKNLMTSAETKDYLLNEDKTKRIAEMQFKFDSEKSEKEIQLLKLRQNRFLLFGISGFFAFMSLLLIYIIRIKGKNNDRLTNKNGEIQAQNIKLKESNEVLKQFAYVAAHDLKEPLRNIGSFINLIQIKYGRQFNEEANEYMGFVKNGVKRLNGLLTDLLEYSQVSAQAPENEMVAISDVLPSVSNSLRSAIHQRKASINYPEKLPALCMSRQHLHQLLQQLISNSIKFSEGRPLIQIDCYRENEDYGVLSVSDNGIGIDKSYSDKIFDLFHRLNRGSAEKEGTGIGLTICKNIVDKYNGEIWFESQEGEGTTFFARLPLKAKIAEDLTAATFEKEDSLLQTA
ncbi:MAG: tetratricopeptide repeat protein [Bacteroidota bacterium]